MNEKKAAERLADLLNEIEWMGHEIRWSSRDGQEGLYVGEEMFIAEPPCEDEPWELREL